MKDECSSSARYKAKFEPRCNCRACWTKWFMNNPNKFVVAKMGLESIGRKTLVKVHGEKYVKFLEQFIREQDSLRPVTAASVTGDSTSDSLMVASQG